jgi:hypothetical protein
MVLEDLKLEEEIRILASLEAARILGRRNGEPEAADRLEDGAEAAGLGASSPHPLRRDRSKDRRKR